MPVNSPSKSSLYSKPSFQSPSLSHSRVLSCYNEHQPDFLYINGFFFFWLCWVFVATRGLSPVTVKGGYSPAAVCGFLNVLAPLAQSTGSRAYRLSSCSTQAQLLRATGDLPRPGIKPTSPALAGRFLTAGPPGKSSTGFLHPSTTQFYVASRQL